MYAASCTDLMLVQVCRKRSNCECLQSTVPVEFDVIVSCPLASSAVRKHTQALYFICHTSCYKHDLL